MQFTSTLLFLLPLAVSSAVLKQRQEPKCSETSGGPNNEAKTAVMDFVKQDVFVDGKFCPPRDTPSGYCGVCQDAIVIIQNESTDENCMTTEMFDDAMWNEFPEGHDVCVTDFGINVVLAVLFAKVSSIHEGGNCENFC